MSATETTRPEPEEEFVEAEIVEPATAVVPVTPGAGELIALTDLSDDQLGELLDKARTFETEQFREFKRAVQQEVLDRMDALTEWTIHGERYDLSGDSPNRTEFDGDELKGVLDDLVDASLLTREQADKALVTKLTLPGTPTPELVERAKKVEYDASRAGVNQLRRLGGAVKTALDSCERPVTKPRAVRITVRPVPGGGRDV